jgi:GT2 family glycosyltransferase
MTPAPTFSVVVPTFARPERLAQCLAGLARLDYDLSRVEVVVVDDGSPDAGAVASAVHTQREALRLRLVRQANAGPAAARNTGVREARHDYIAFTDDDCRVEPGWLSAFARRFAAQPECLAGGRTINALQDNIYTSASESLVGYFQRYHLEKGTPFFATNNVALPRALFGAIGGFDERFPRAAGEDREFCGRCVRQRRDFAYVPEAVVHHYHALTLRQFWRQHFNYGRGAYFFRQLHARDTGAQNVELEPLSFYTDLVFHPVSNRERRALRLVLLMFVTQLANSSGFFVERARRRRLAPPGPLPASPDAR